MLDIPPHIEKFISSQKMEDSAIQERLLYLGKKLAKNFEDHSGDEISIWMAHYIAEKMTAIRSARGKTKTLAQRECFEAILLLWERQACFPPDVRPFNDFEPIFRALAHIDPSKEFPSYFSHENNSEAPSKSTEQYANLIVNLDAATRIIMSYFVREAILSATDESTLQWLHGIKGIAESNEAKVILKLLPELDLVEEDEEKVQAEYRIKELSEHIDRLEKFVNVTQHIRSSLKAKLDSLEAEKH